MEKHSKNIFAHAATQLLIRIRAAFRETSGVTSIEFGLIAPVFILMLVGMFEVGMIMIAQNSLDAAASRAARAGFTGQTNGTLSREDTIKQIVRDTVVAFSGGMLNPDKVKVSVSSYESLDSLGRPEPLVSDLNNNGEWDPGEAYIDKNGNGSWDADQGVSDSFGVGGDAVQYTISYDWKTILSYLGMHGVITLKGTTQVVNEDFKLVN